MKIPQVKYRINHFLSMLPMQISIEGFALIVEKQFDIKTAVFHADRSIKEDESIEIPPERLQVYAFLLGATVKDLSQKVSPSVQSENSRLLN
jgi:hypothetical protein